MNSPRIEIPLGVVVCPLALQADGPGLPILGLIRRNARRFGERYNSQDKERDACVEDRHSAPPPGECTMILFGPVATERPAIHVFGLRGLASAIVFTRARREQI